MAPETRIVPVAVRGVIAAKPHWLARIKRTASERDKRAAALQLVAMVAHGARPTTARVRFGTPLLIADFAQNIEGLHNTLIARMGQLIADGRAAVPTALAATPEERLDWRPANTGVVIQ